MAARRECCPRFFRCFLPRAFFLSLSFFFDAPAWRPAQLALEYFRFYFLFPLLSYKLIFSTWEPISNDLFLDSWESWAAVCSAAHSNSLSLPPDCLAYLIGRRIFEIVLHNYFQRLDRNDRFRHTSRVRSPAHSTTAAMASVAQTTRNHITLKGSTEIVTEFFGATAGSGLFFYLVPDAQKMSISRLTRVACAFDFDGAQATASTRCCISAACIRPKILPPSKSMVCR